ncbi:hypothetical protein B0H13DRAFT_1932625 [Mycena leptocephala]|nr:hypothetical protein B0H13DRAFT_1932625 [Mycena leptocephala]
MPHGHLPRARPIADVTLPPWMFGVHKRKLANSPATLDNISRNYPVQTAPSLRIKFKYASELLVFFPMSRPSAAGVSIDQSDYLLTCCIELQCASNARDLWGTGWVVVLRRFSSKTRLPFRSRVLDVSPDLFEKFGTLSLALSCFCPVHIVFCNPDAVAFAFVGRSSRGTSICFTRLTICNVRNPKNEKIKEEKDSLPTRCSAVASELWLPLVPPSGHHFFLCVPEAADAEVEVKFYDA